MNKLIQYAVMAVVGVLVFTALLVPVINEGMKTAGDSVTYTNNAVGSFKLNDTSETVIFERNADDTITLNGETIAKKDGFALASDTLSVFVAFGGRYYVVDQFGEIYSISAASTDTFTVTYQNGTVTFNNPANASLNTSETYTWLYSPADNGGWVTAYFNNAGYTYYVKSPNDVICTGYYSTGENDTGYLYKNNELTLTGDYTGSVDYTLTLVDGTTDIYRMTDFKVNVNDESFTPWCTLIKADVVGHATSGATYDMLGIIPLLVIVGLIMGVVGVVVTRRLD